MKNFALKLIKSFSIFLLFSLLACNSGLNGVSDHEDKQSSGTVAYLSAVKFGASGRAILPNESFDLKGKDIYKFILKGKPLDGEEIVYEPWVQTSTEFAYDKMDNDLRDNKIALGIGSYIFTIQAYALPEGVTCSDEDADTKAFLVLEKTTNPVIIKSGRNTIEFGTLDEVAGNGSLSIKVNFPDEGVKSVSVCMTPQDEENGYSVADRSLSIEPPLDKASIGGSRNVVFADDPKNGWYVVKFTFTMDNGAGETSQVWSELVQIATGRKTQAEVNIENLNTIYPVEYKCNGGSFKGNNVHYSYTPYQDAIPMPELEDRNVATFVGWYSDPNFKNPVTQIPAGSKGAKTFYAKWKYNVTSDALYACGEKIILQQKEGSDNVTYAYFDKVDEDNIVLNDDGRPFSIHAAMKVYGSLPNGSYPADGKDDITIQSGSVGNIYARGESNGSVTVNGGSVRFIESTGTVNINGGSILGDDNNGTSTLDSIKTTSANAVVNIAGGTIKGNVYGTVEGGTLIHVSGTPLIGNKKNIGIDLSAARDKKIIAGNLNHAAEESITLIAPTATEGTVLATFEGQAYTKFFAIINSDRKRNAQVVGNDVMVNGDLSLPTSLKADESDANTFYVFGENVTKKGTIFSVFADGGYFNVGDTSLEGASFSMGIPLDANFKENGYADSVSTETNFRYIQFTSTGGDISSEKANAFLNKIKFHKIDNKPFKIRINLETVPIKVEDKDGKKGYELNTDVFYFDGSFYKKSEPFDNGTKVSWQQAYNKAKEERFNGLQGYLMTITSDAENKFIYDQVFKAEREDGKTPDDFGSWIGGTRKKPKVNYDASAWQSDGFNKYWSWACGPEAGKVFYTNTFYRDDKDYRAEGMYSAWSNPVDCKINGIERAYSSDYEPNNEAGTNHTGGDNSNTEKEVYLQYTGHYVWNDASTGNGSLPRWRIHYYIVEFTPYENPVAGIAIPTDPAVYKANSHAEQSYE